MEWETLTPTTQLGINCLISLFTLILRGHEMVARGVMMVLSHSNHIIIKLWKNCHCCIFSLLLTCYISHLFFATLPMSYQLITSSHYFYPILHYQHTPVGCQFSYLTVFPNSWFSFTVLPSWTRLLPLVSSLSVPRFFGRGSLQWLS